MSAGEYLTRAMRALAESGPGSAEAASVHAVELARALAPLVAEVRAMRAKVAEADREVLRVIRERDDYGENLAAAQAKIIAADGRLAAAERALVLVLCGAGE